MYNPHHKRALQRIQACIKNCKLATIEFEADPSNTSSDNADKVQQAYILLMAVEDDLNHRRVEHNQQNAARRIKERTAK